MNRAINDPSELDALPWGAVIERTVPDEHAEDWHKRRDGMWLCDDGDILTAGGLVLYAERRNAALVPAPSVVPEVAVEAATAAVRRERAFAAAAAFGVPLDAVPQCAEMIAHAALTAALPHLTAAPSATREASADEVAEVVTEALTDAYRDERGMSRHRGLSFEDEAAIRDRASRVIELMTARFTITERTDR